MGNGASTLRLSIAMCTFQGARHLPAQLESILKQTRMPDELVACDDGSTDASVALLEEFARRAPFPVRIEVNASRMGSTANFEKALRLCSGDLLAPCDQDDAWAPQKLERTVRGFEADPRLGLTFTDGVVVDDHLRPLGYGLWDSVGFTSAARRQVRQGRALDVLLRRWVVTGTTMTFRSSHLPLLLPIPPTWVHDAWIALLVCLVAPVQMLEEALVLYRSHPSQQLGVARRSLSATVRRAMTTGPAEYAREVDRFQALLDRIRSAGLVPDGPAAQARVGSKLAHLKVRLAISLDPSRTSRIAAAFRELLRGGYSRYSPAVHHVLKDAFFPRSAS